MLHFEKRSVFEASVEDVFAFHERPEALRDLIPPWDPSTIVQPPSSLEAGTEVILETRVGPFKQRIEAVHTAYEKNALFVDEMRKGPFKYWRHEHRFEAHPKGCLLIDSIDYLPPLGFLGRLADPIAIKPRLRKMFEWRHRVTAQAVERSSVSS